METTVSPLFHLDAPDADRIAAGEDAHIGHREADRLAAAGGEQYIVLVGADGNADQAVALVELHGDLAIGLYIDEIAEFVAADITAGGREHDMAVARGRASSSRQGHQCGDRLAIAERQHVDQRLAARLRIAERQAIDLGLVDHALGGEEQHRRMRVGDKDTADQSSSRVDIPESGPCRRAAAPGRPRAARA